jgi:hypothetical protein
MSESKMLRGEVKRSKEMLRERIKRNTFYRDKNINKGYRAFFQSVGSKSTSCVKAIRAEARLAEGVLSGPSSRPLREGPSGDDVRFDRSALL